jgi:hypothetical protein
LKEPPVTANNFVKKKNNFGLLRMFSSGDAMRHD